MIRFTPNNEASPEAGKVLLSEPFLDDPCWKKGGVAVRTQ